MPLYEHPFRPAFVGRSDEDVARLIAPSCCECHQKYPVAAEPADWAVSNMRDINMLEAGPRESLIRVKRLDSERRHYLCGDCAADYLEDWL